MKIIIRKDGQFFREVDFTSGDLVLGRSTEADVQLLHEDISRKHTLLSLKRGKLTIQDLGSKNGTFMQGAKIEKTSLEAGEIFNIGPFSISVEKEAPQSQRTVVEHDLSEAPTRTFYVEPNDETRDPSRSLSPADFPSLRDENEEAEEKEESSPAHQKEQDEESDSDSFLDAISVAPETSTPSFSIKDAEEIEEDIFPAKEVEEEPAENEDEIESDPKLELEHEALAEEEDADQLTTNPYQSVPEYLKEAAKRGKVDPNKTEVVEPVVTTKPHDSFKDIQLDEEMDQEQIKTEIRRPESTMERSLKDFPSASEAENDSNSGEFFLNREIDEEGIPGSFENFPDTNKIKPAENVPSAFDTASIGSVEEEDVKVEKTDPLFTEPAVKSKKSKGKIKKPANDDEISTSSFSNAETQLSSPEEDQIKTFMFNSKELGDDDGAEKTDEYSNQRPSKSVIKKLLANLPAMKSKAQTWIKKPGRKKIAFITGAVVLGLMMFFMMEGGLFHSEPVDPETAINSEEGFQNLSRGEKKRVILFQIDQVQKLITKKEVAEADERMKKLMTLATKDEEFIKFEKEYQRQRDAIVAEETRKKKEEEDRIKKKNDALKEAKQMMDNKKYDLAKKTYLRILEIFPDDPEVQEKIQTLELQQEQEERKTFAKKQRYDMLTKIFNEGVQKYESGQVGVAQKLFKQVTAEKGHPKYKKAMEYLNKVDTMADKKIDQKIARAKDMINNPDTLLAGYAELKKITAQFPLRSDAKKYFADAKVKMEKKARELYADALAQEELAGDPAAALDLYKEVLKYAPDKSNKYNQKAQAKINSLQI